MSRGTVFNLETFDFEKHYVGIYNKLRKFLRDFDIEEYIHFKNVTKQNNCLQCHIQISEPITHEQAKKKLFNLFVNEPNYLVESELRANKQLYVPGKGIRPYQFDVFVINVPNFIKFMNIMVNYLNIDNDETRELDFQLLKELEQELYFAVEADGGSHSDDKDAVRDRFFFTNYNIVTVRYEVNDLVHVEETKKMKKTRLKYNIYKAAQDPPIFENITSEDIVKEAKNIYRSKYSHLQ